MKNDNNKRFDAILNSMKGSRKAKPTHDLFDRIEQNLDESPHNVFQLFSWKYAVASAALILFVNIFAIHQIYSSKDKLANTDEQAYTAYTLLSNYKIYE